MSSFPWWRLVWISLLLCGCAALGETSPPQLPKDKDAILLNNSELLDLFQNQSLTRALVERHSLPAAAVARAVSLAQEFSTQSRPSAGDSPAVGQSREADYGRQISELFSPEERITLRRLCWRERGGDALVNDYVAQVLKLQPEQLTRLKELRERFDRDMQSEINSMPRVTADYFQQVRNTARAKKLAAMLDVLSAEQRARWSELTEAK